MSRTAVNLILGALLATLLVLNGTARRDFARPHLEFLPDMAHSVAYETFAPNPVFADGKTLQSPVPGTIARGHRPLHFDSTPEDAARASRELQNPFTQDDTEALSRGASLFASFCRTCHGTDGLGDGPVARHGFPPPPSLSAEHAVEMADGQIFHVITYGQGNMPPHAAQLTRDDRWKVILFLRSLHSRTPAPAASPSEPSEAPRP